MINFCDIDIKRLDKYLWNYKKGLSLQKKHLKKLVIKKRIYTFAPA
jgi:hypothetical protein